MKLTEIASVIIQGESETLEFKKSTAELRPAFETVCAFLNCNGGMVLIGVTDKGQMIGQDVADSTKQAIAHEINKLEPHQQIEIKYLLLDNNKKIIIISITKGLHAPYTYDGRAFQRDQSVTKKMSQQRYDRLVAKRSQLNYSWEKHLAVYDINNLDHTLIFNVMRDAVNAKRLTEFALQDNIQNILEKLELSKDGILLNAAIVLFGKKFLPDYPQCQLKMARFKNYDRQEFLDSDASYGNIFVLLEKGMQFVKKHIPVAATIEEGKLQRVEKPIIPFEAIREALINSLCHKDYGIYSGSISLAIYDDRMELFNDGSLLPDVTLEKIKAGFSKPRNQLIADILYKCGLVERWGRGIQTIIKDCVQANDPEPEFLIDNLEFGIKFRFPHELRIKVSQKDVLRGRHKNLSERQLDILIVLLEQGAISIQLIEGKLAEAIPRRTLQNELSKLQKMGFLQKEGGSKKTLWSLTSK